MKPSTDNRPATKSGQPSALFGRRDCLRTTASPVNKIAPEDKPIARKDQGGISPRMNLTAGQFNPQNTPIMINSVMSPNRIRFKIFYFRSAKYFGSWCPNLPFFVKFQQLIRNRFGEFGRNFLESSFGRTDAHMVNVMFAVNGHVNVQNRAFPLMSAGSDAFEAA